MDATLFGPWEAAAVLSKALLYAATFVAAGGVFFRSTCGALLTVADWRRVEVIIGSASLGVVILGGLRVPLLAAQLSGTAAGIIDPAMLGMVLDSAEGRALLVRVVGVVFAAVALSGPQRAAWLALPGAAMAAMSFAMAGHVQAMPNPSVAATLESVHLLCVAFWLGALTPLWCIGRYDEQGERFARVARRVGHMALVVVAILLMAGVALLWMMLGHAEPNWSSGYVRLMCVKLSFALVLLSLAALNKLRLTPGLLAGERLAAGRLMRSIRAEMALGGGILLVTALLTTLTGPPLLE